MSARDAKDGVAAPPHRLAYENEDLQLLPPPAAAPTFRLMCSAAREMVVHKSKYRSAMRRIDRERPVSAFPTIIVLEYSRS